MKQQPCCSSHLSSLICWFTSGVGTAGGSAIAPPSPQPPFTFSNSWIRWTSSTHHQVAVRGSETHKLSLWVSICLCSPYLIPIFSSPVYVLWNPISYVKCKDDRLVSWVINEVGISSSSRKVNGRGIGREVPLTLNTGLTKSSISHLHYCTFMKTQFKSEFQEVFQISPIPTLSFLIPKRRVVLCILSGDNSQAVSHILVPTSRWWATMSAITSHVLLPPPCHPSTQ